MSTATEQFDCCIKNRRIVLICVCCHPTEVKNKVVLPNCFFHFQHQDKMFTLKISPMILLSQQQIIMRDHVILDLVPFDCLYSIILLMDYNFSPFNLLVIRCLSLHHHHCIIFRQFLSFLAALLVESISHTQRNVCNYFYLRTLIILNNKEMSNRY